MEKLTITNIDTDDSMEFGFNPTQVSYQQGVRYRRTRQQRSRVPKKDFQGGTGGRLSFELLLDATIPPGPLATEYTIKDRVNWLLTLLEIEERDTTVKKATKKLPRAPYCKINWGEETFFEPDSSSDPVLVALSSINVTYTLFKADGTPLRAKANLSFEDVSSKIQGQNPTSRSEARKTWRVTQGETLDWIAYKEYGDPTQWRYIAETNNLANPLDLYPGQILKIVPLP